VTTKHLVKAIFESWVRKGMREHYRLAGFDPDNMAVAFTFMGEPMTVDLCYMLQSITMHERHEAAIQAAKS
jgi:hypothetical protein